MIALAFIEKDIHTILESGRSVLDPKSKVCGEYMMISSPGILKVPDNWKETRKLLRDKYTQENNNMRDDERI